jgi:hypothetical protein
MFGRAVAAAAAAAEWCLKGVDQCWKEKQQFYAAVEMEDAKAAYEHARQVYRTILSESE